MSGLETDTNHLYYFYFISFIITFIFPILTIENTIGKKILKLEWENRFDIKIKLLLKYFIYYLTVAPSFSILSALTSFPLINPLFSNLDKIIVLQFLLAFFITDITVFLLSLGKYHILDYLLNAKLHKHSFTRNPSKFLATVYLFFGLFFIASIYVYKYNFTVSKIEDSIGSAFENEHYPTDKFYGSYVYTLNQNSDGVFKPTKPLSFIFKQKFRQKTLYLNLPKEVFNSENERKSICINLLLQSLTNDMFSEIKPEQTRIVLSNIEKGFFLEYYNYYYIYYFDNDLVGWNIYGGIVADSITMHNYIDFNYIHNKSLISKIERIEDKHNMSWGQIVKKSENDKILANEIDEIFNPTLTSQLFYDKLKISLDTNKLELKKIDFSDAKLNGYMNINFPISNIERRVNFTNLINGEILEFDENVAYLKLLRDETTNKGM